MSLEKQKIFLTISVEVMDEVKKHIAERGVTRTKWFTDAVQDRIEKENREKLGAIIKGTK